MDFLSILITLIIMACQLVGILTHFVLKMSLKMLKVACLLTLKMLKVIIVSIVAEALKIRSLVMMALLAIIYLNWVTVCSLVHFSFVGLALSFIFTLIFCNLDSLIFFIRHFHILCRRP